MGQVIANHMKDAWKKWNIRGLLILSLSLQTILMFFAPLRRRTRSKKLLTLLLWSSYLLADWSANFAVGLITTNQAKDFKPNDPPQNKKLMALWAPFLLLHLGGPDTITAFSLEDNSLWTRHLLGLVFQVLAGVFVVLQSLPNTLWVPILLLFIAGFIKYVERIAVLYLASSEKFRSLLPHSYSKATKERLLELQQRADRGFTHHEILQLAFRFLFHFKSLMANGIFRRSIIEESKTWFPLFTPDDTLRIIEAQLSLIYDVLYTKVALLHTWTETVFRVLALGSLVSAFRIFHYGPEKRHEFHGADIVITYTLFLIGIALDVASILMFTLSDWTFFVLRKEIDRWNDKPSGIDRLLNWFLGFKRLQWKKRICYKENNFVIEHDVLAVPFLVRRWAGNIYSFNFIAYCLKADVKRIHDVKCAARCFDHVFMKIIQTFWGSIARWISGVQRSTDRVINQVAPGILYPFKTLVRFWFHVLCFFRLIGNFIIEFLNIKDMLDDITREEYISSEPLTKNLWISILARAKISDKFPTVGRNVEELLSVNVERAMSDILSSETLDHDRLKRDMVDVDYDESLLMWHIVTEICYQEEESTRENCDDREISKILSDYMMYLMIMQPKLMSDVAGIGMITFRDTMTKADKFIRNHIKNLKDMKRCIEEILSLETEIDQTEVEGDPGKTLLLDAISLVEELKRLEDRGDSKWKVLSKLWVELLCYAACHCNGKTRLQLVSRGGELVHLVWLLMSHFRDEIDKW